MSKSSLIRTASIVLAFVSTVAVHAAVPQLIPYQGRLTDAVDDPVTDGAHLVKFIIYDAPAAGAEIWNSGFQNVTTVNGLFVYGLGTNVALTDNIFTDTSRYLGVTVGVDPEITPRTRFETSAYAYHALRADSAGHASTANTATTAATALSAASAPWAGLTGVPAGFADGIDADAGGDITSVTAGAGLSGGGSSGAIGLSVGVGSVTSAMIQDGVVNGVDIGTNTITAVDIATGGVASAEVLDNSLTASDLASNSVGASEIASNAVGTSEIATNGVGSAELQDFLEGRVGIATVFGGSSSSSVVTVDSVYFTPPGSGYVIMTVLGGWWYNADATTSSSLYASGAFYLSTSKNSSGSANGATQSIDYVDPDNSSSTNSTGTLNMQRVDFVSGGVQKKYFVNIRANGTHSLSCYSTRVSVVFVPFQMGVGSAPPVSPNPNVQPELILQSGSDQN